MPDFMNDEPADKPVDPSMPSDDEIRRILDHLLEDALRQGVSDIYLEPQRDGMRVRLRRHGTMVQRPPVPALLMRPLTAMLKVRTRMNIMERRRAQSGGFQAKFEGRTFAFLARILPCVEGENIRITIQELFPGPPALEHLGFEDEDLVRLQGVLRQGRGMVLFTALREGGKSTTMYASAASVSSEQKTMFAIADWAPFPVPGLNQVLSVISEGTNAASGLRAALLHDPDLVLVDDIHSSESSESQLKAAIQGRLMLASMQVPSGVEGISRFIDMGISRYLISGALVCVVSQKLVQSICSDCKVEDPKITEQIKAAGLDPEEFKGVTLYRGKGCDKCFGTGVAGRTGVFEVLVPGEEMRHWILDWNNLAEAERMANSLGYNSIRTNMVAKLKRGEISLDELTR